ncbi:hypothetical protein CAPTEDRAFT_184217 [Capitella teleta]|uniref:Ig-like domain-containing protein n=1 Tax=Capitella teleta TaxID=283909 RepID=X1ZGW8_CAPTE|nr:hypothetical protein CAPTEDRAFT_184217 [Capitella teleta]|eukprot:ELU00248.1 hypothetical protein CAPTEDRAFT_184217 [Capitella teleta]
MGVTGRLVCVVINQMDNPVYWIHKWTQTTISTDDKIVIDDAHNTIVNGWPKYQVERTYSGERIIYTIIVNRLEPRDAGLYTCQILVRGSNEHPSKDGEMVVLIPPAVIMSVTSNTISVEENDKVNLTCGASGYPTPNITWVRVNGGLLPNEELRHQGTFYSIDPVQKEDRGVYRCLADNNVRPPAVHDATLTVIFRPTARAVQSSYGQAENRMFDITIECRIAGWPEPDLQWYKVLSGGSLSPINNDDKHTINILLNHANILDPNERWFQMVIRSVQANDFGDYVCKGCNDLGCGEGVVNLFATSECQGPNCPPEQDVPSKSPTSALSFSILLLISVLFIIN